MRISLSLSHANSNKRPLWPALGLPLLNETSLPPINPKDTLTRWQSDGNYGNARLICI